MEELEVAMVNSLNQRKKIEFDMGNRNLNPFPIYH